MIFFKIEIKVYIFYRNIRKEAKISKIKTK